MHGQHSVSTLASHGKPLVVLHSKLAESCCQLRRLVSRRDTVAAVQCNTSLPTSTVRGHVRHKRRVNSDAVDAAMTAWLSCEPRVSASRAHRALARHPRLDLPICTMFLITISPICHLCLAPLAPLARSRCEDPRCGSQPAVLLTSPLTMSTQSFPLDDRQP